MIVVGGLWLLAILLFLLVWSRLKGMEKRADKMRDRFIRCLPAIRESQGRRHRAPTEPTEKRGRG